MLPKSELKYIQSLNQKKFRQEYGHFLAEGPKLVNELLAKQPTLLHKIFATADWWNRQPASTRELIGNKIAVIEAFELAKISNLQNPHDLLAIVNLPEPVFQFPNLPRGFRNSDQPAEPRTEWLLALDGIQDPGNLGTIIRTAHWFGVHTLLCSDDCADAFSPKVVQSSMGSIFRVEIVYLDLADFFSTNQLPVYGALLKGQSIRKKTEYKKGIIVIGNEGQGIRQELIPFINHPVTVPGFGDAESLNAAIAAGILLYSFTHH